MVQFAGTAMFNPSDFTSDFMSLLSIFIARNFKTVSLQKSWAPKINIHNTPKCVDLLWRKGVEEKNYAKDRLVFSTVNRRKLLKMIKLEGNKRKAEVKYWKFSTWEKNFQLSNFKKISVITSQLRDQEQMFNHNGEANINIEIYYW